MSALPEPPESLRLHSEQLAKLIKERIRANGPMRFSEYMQAALYEPGHGYYVSGNPVFGAQGDFITAPGLGRLFGSCLARQCDEVLLALESKQSAQSEQSTDSSPVCIEFGAGDGSMACVVIEYLAQRRAERGLPPVDYHIIETSAALIERQQAAIAQLPEALSTSVTWHQSLPAAVSGVVIANEVLDAMPVERFEITDGTVRLMEVALDATTDQLVERPTNGAGDATAEVGDEQDDASANINTMLGEQLTQLPEGYRAECNALLPGWVAAISQMLDAGALIVIDYGYPRREYYLPERDSGTLMCYYRQHAHNDPYFLPGAQDITAHVDFTAVAEAGVAAGFSLNGYTSQASFLHANGLLDLAEQQVEKLPDPSGMEAVRLMQEVKTLSLPGTMGERFQVMALSKHIDFALRGFLDVDLSHRL